jgi:hypothetical protein
VSAETDDLAEFLRQAARLSPVLMLAYLRSMRDLARAITTESLVRLLERGDLGAIVAELLPRTVTDAAFVPMQFALRQIMEAAGAREFAQIPSAPVGGGAVPVPIASVRFNVLSPSVTKALATFETKVLDEVAADVRGAVQLELADLIRSGANPRAMATAIKGMLGLSPAQEQYILNYRAQLEALADPKVRAALRAALARGDTPAVLDRQLTDGNIDRTVRAAIKNDRALTAAEMDKAEGRYRQNWIRNQAETVSRTATLNLMRESQDLAWEQAVAANKINEADIVDTWITTLDGRERATHHAMHGTQKGFRDVWFVPGVGPQRYPGEDEHNCRCRVWRSLRIRSARERAALPRATRPTPRPAA